MTEDLVSQSTLPFFVDNEVVFLACIEFPLLFGGHQGSYCYTMLQQFT
eukprot:CCRYP_010502-RA/>CCRYP_010502-RA protein AED:0.00 eAED:0.00 QI:26/1/1/1/0/0/2/53/47